MDSRIQQLSGTWAKLYTSPEPELKQSLNSVDSQTDKALLLTSIPPPPTPSHRPLQLLHTFLTGISGNWPVFDLISCHTRLLKYLPDDTTSRADPDVKALVESTSDLIKKSYSAFSDFLVDDSQPALRTTQPEKYISHRGLKNYVSNFRLPVGTESTPTVAIALPNGPLLAATCIATTTYFTSAPINPAVGPEQFEADVKQSRASFILTTPEYYDKLELRTWTTDAKIDIVFVDWDEGDKIVLQSPDGRALSTTEGYRRTNAPNDIGLVLFTSGTSGTKKTVPLTVHSIVSGIVFVAESWGLSKSDVCLNMMPLYHV